MGEPIADNSRRPGQREIYLPGSYGTAVKFLLSFAPDNRPVAAHELAAGIGFAETDRDCGV
jgi:hypothetical protein